MIAMVILLVFFIIGSGYLLIYNVLYISISKDTRFYGLMKTLGTTQKPVSYTHLLELINQIAKDKNKDIDAYSVELEKTEDFWYQ